MDGEEYVPARVFVNNPTAKQREKKVSVFEFPLFIHRNRLCFLIQGLSVEVKWNTHWDKLAEFKTKGPKEEMRGLETALRTQLLSDCFSSAPCVT